MDLFVSSSSSDEDILSTSGINTWYVFKENTQKKDKTHPLNRKRFKYGEFHHLYEDIRKDPVRFFEYMRMKISTFDHILKKIGSKLDKVYKNCHAQPINLEEKLMITLR